MGEIMKINHSLDAATLTGAEAARTKPSAANTVTKEAATPVQDDASQLTKLSSVINGLKRGATVMREHATQAMSAVRSGKYEVDPIQVSRRIVSDSLAWPR
jgi:hypothetical protein